MRVRFAAAALIVGVAGAAVPAAAATYTALYSFGDSLSDVGNVYASSGGAYPVAAYSGQGFTGRFTNGPNWLDDLSTKLSLGTESPSANGGRDYAVGGAQTGKTNANPSPIPLVDLDQQVQTFKLVDPSPQSGALYTLDIGANDIGNALSTFASSPTRSADLTIFLEQAIGNTVNAVDDLFAAGARSLLYFEVPDLALAPAFAKYGADAATLASEFNSGVLAGLAPLEAQGLTVFDLPVFADIQDIYNNPGKYGLSDVTTACFSGGPTTDGTVCSDPNSYLFWDTEHPTAAAHALIADAAFDLLNGTPPNSGGTGDGDGVAAAAEPATWALLAGGFAALGLLRRVRRRATASL